MSTDSDISMDWNRPPEAVRLHWNYLLALEKDLEVISRYIEFCSANFNVYSIELAHLLLSAASEVDTLLKCICAILQPKAKPRNIDGYRKIIREAEDTEVQEVGLFSIGGKVVPENLKHRVSSIPVYIPRHNLEFVPWASWAQDANPDWWHSYNKVKHERNRHFDNATLSNALNALGALLCVNYLHCRLELSKTTLQRRYEYRYNAVTRRLQPESTFLRFSGGYYDNPYAELGQYISSVSRDVSRLRDRE